jgi:hypothetical protein
MDVMVWVVGNQVVNMPCLWRCGAKGSIWGSLTAMIDDYPHASTNYMHSPAGGSCIVNHVST